MKPKITKTSIKPTAKKRLTASTTKRATASSSRRRSSNYQSFLRSSKLPNKLLALIFVALFMAVGIFVIMRSFASTAPIATVEAEAMVLPTGTSIVADSTASATQALKLASNGAATSSFTLTTPATTLSVRAKGIICKGAPQMVVKVDGTQVLVSSVSATSWSESYTANVNLAAASHNLSVAFTNDNNRNNCSRDLYVDKLTFFGVATTPSPTQMVSPTPTPVATCLAKTAWEPLNASFQPLGDSIAASHICATPENRPNNTTANHYVPSSTELQAFRTGQKDQYGRTAVQANPYSQYVTGNFSGTTDEIIQWAAWKWGIPTDWLRAQYVNESWWRHETLGDRRTVSATDYNLHPVQARIPNTLDVYESLGLTQVKWRPDGTASLATEPLRWKSTAFNVDYQAGAVRFYFDDPQGVRTAWGDSTYQKGQEWLSIGGWFQPYPWNNAGQQDYIKNVQTHLNNRTWAQPGF